MKLSKSNMRTAKEITGLFGSNKNVFTESGKLSLPPEIANYVMHSIFGGTKGYKKYFIVLEDSPNVRYNLEKINNKFYATRKVPFDDGTIYERTTYLTSEDLKVFENLNRLEKVELVSLMETLTKQARFGI